MLSLCQKKVSLSRCAFILTLGEEGRQPLCLVAVSNFGFLRIIEGLGGKTLGLIMILVSFVGFGLYRFSGLSHVTIWIYCFFLYFWLRISPSLFVLNLS